MFPCHRSHSWTSSGHHFLVKNSYVLAFDIIENGHSCLFSTKMGVVWPLIIDQRLVNLTPTISTKMGVVWPFIIGQRLVHLTPHIFPCNRSHSWISGGDHFLVKNSLELAFGIIENGRSWLFSTKMGVVWPFIIDQRLVHLTPHMFLCHRLHSLISGGHHFLVKNPYVLAFAIIENGHSWLFSTKMRIVWPLIIDQRLVNLTHICFLAIDHIL
jgi:hypothetical protein